MLVDWKAILLRSIHPKLTDRFITILMKNVSFFLFAEIDTLTLIAKTVLRKKYKVEGLTFPEFRTY